MTLPEIKCMHQLFHDWHISQISWSTRISTSRPLHVFMVFPLLLPCISSLNHRIHVQHTGIVLKRYGSLVFDPCDVQCVTPAHLTLPSIEATSTQFGCLAIMHVCNSARPPRSDPPPWLTFAMYH
jgi:hypothetical protein